VTPLDPRHLTLLRIHFAIGALVLLAACVAGDLLWVPRPWPPAWWLAGAGALLFVPIVWLLPRRRYNAWGFLRGEDELMVKHGLLIRKLTVVPFGRVQHIDIAQGPLQRMLGIATLVLNTAGTRGAAVRLPGLDRSEAEALRDHVRGEIRQDLM
jgi:uncharacterized protein